MEVLTRYELHLRQKEIAEKIKQGAIFIYPTDTIYGLGCNALDEKVVEKIRKLKGRGSTPFSILAPSPKWIKDNCFPSPQLNKWLKELPGPYTLIAKLKNKASVSKNVIPGLDTLGIRIPDHWFHQFIEKLALPIITTSANKTGNTAMTSLENLDPEIKKHVEFIIYEGEKNASPSKRIDLTNEKIISR